MLNYVRLLKLRFPFIKVSNLSHSYDVLTIELFQGVL